MPASCRAIKISLDFYSLPQYLISVEAAEENNSIAPDIHLFCCLDNGKPGELMGLFFEVITMTIPNKDMQRLMNKIQNPYDLFSCWLWTASLSKKGYARFNLGGIIYHAHRLTYQYFIGPIPVGVVPDHRCNTPRCVNPYHLELVTNGENIRRGYVLRRARTTHCRHGHPYILENIIYDKKGLRRCKTCERNGQRRWKQKQKLLVAHAINS